MPGAEISNVTGQWANGILYLKDALGNTLVTVGASTGLRDFAGPMVKTVTTASTLTQADKGKLVLCGVDATIITLPVASTTTLPGGTLRIMNTATGGGAQIVVITTTGDSILGADISTSNLFANTKATQTKGDMLSITATGSSSWYVSDIRGIWASTT